MDAAAAADRCCSHLELANASEAIRHFPTRLRTRPRPAATLHCREAQSHSTAHLPPRRDRPALRLARNRCAIVDLFPRLTGAQSLHKRTRRTQTRRRPSRPRTTKPVEIERSAVATNFSRHSRCCAQDDTDAAHGLYQFKVLPIVEFSTQMREMNIDHIIKRRCAIRFSPNFTRNHLPRYRFIM